MKMKTLVKIEQDAEAPIETKVLAQAIVDMSRAMKALLASGLNRKAIIILVAAHSGIQNKSTVTAVLDSLETLAQAYTK